MLLLEARYCSEMTRGKAPIKVLAKRPKGNGQETDALVFKTTFDRLDITIESSYTWIKSSDISQKTL